MPHIPQEILDNIIGYASADGQIYLSALSSYSSCAFVSHTFHQIALPYKFNSLTFTIPNFRVTDVIPIPKFCEAINAGDPHALSLAPLVLELSLLRWCSSDNNDLIQLEEPFEKIINSVLSFRNLTKLRMEYCLTTPTIMEQLGKLVTPVVTHITRLT